MTIHFRKRAREARGGNLVSSVAAPPRAPAAEVVVAGEVVALIVLVVAIDGGSAREAVGEPLTLLARLRVAPNGRPHSTQWFVTASLQYLPCACVCVSCAWACVSCIVCGTHIPQTRRIK
jgi:hypothetical protein